MTVKHFHKGYIGQADLLLLSEQSVLTDSDPARGKVSEVSRRGMLKWAGALAAVGVVGVGLGLGGDLLLRPNNTTTKTATETSVSTATKTNTQLVTATATQTQTSTQTQTVTVTPPAQTITQTTTAPSSEVLLTGAHDTGPFIAHIVNGVWVKSSPLLPNLPVGHNAFSVRNRVMAR